MSENITDQIRTIEALSANAWRPLVVQHLDGWRMRYTGGTSGRVNSVWPNQCYGSLSLEERIEIVEDFYRRRKQPAIFSICPGNLPVNLHVVLLDRGYEDLKLTALETAPIEVVIERTQLPQGEIAQTDRLSESWFEAYTTASEYSPESLPIRRGILSRIGPRTNFLMVAKDGEPAAVGLGVAERGWMGVFNLITFKKFRRQGFASQVMRGLAEWGKSVGVEQVYLQVMENNPPALVMYEKQGFKKLYHYWYCQKYLD